MVLGKNVIKTVMDNANIERMSCFLMFLHLVFLVCQENGTFQAKLPHVASGFSQAEYHPDFLMLSVAPSGTRGGFPFHPF